jgi:hypothetical protein
MINIRIFHRAKKMMSFHMHTMKLPEAIPWISHSISMCPCIFHYIVSHCLWLSINYSLSMSMYKSPIIYIYIYMYYIVYLLQLYVSLLNFLWSSHDFPWFPWISRRITNSKSFQMFQVLPGTRKIAEFQARMDEPWLFISGRWPPCWWWISELSCTIEIHWWQLPL